MSVGVAVEGRTLGRGGDSGSSAGEGGKEIRQGNPAKNYFTQHMDEKGEAMLHMLV
jgi:hypothetical protein